MVAYTSDVKLGSAAVAMTVAVATSGCGARATYQVTAPTETTVLRPSPGADVRCTKHGTTARATAPRRGTGVSVDADGLESSASLELTRKSDGALIISCHS